MPAEPDALAREQSCTTSTSPRTDVKQDAVYPHLSASLTHPLSSCACACALPAAPLSVDELQRWGREPHRGGRADTLRARLPGAAACPAPPACPRLPNAPHEPAMRHTARGSAAAALRAVRRSRSVVALAFGHFPKAYARLGVHVSAAVTS